MQIAEAFGDWYRPPARTSASVSGRAAGAYLGFMDHPHRNLAVAVGAAKDHAKAVLGQLERQGHTQSGRSSTLYLALVVIHQQLQADDPPPPRHFLPDLEQLARRCEGRLAPIKPLLEAAVRLAREGGEG